MSLNVDENKSRYFNSIDRIDTNFIRKTSTHKFKLRDEINWYLNCPKQFQQYLPEIKGFSFKPQFLEMKCYDQDFGTLLVNNSNIDWELFFIKIENCLKDLHSVKDVSNDAIKNQKKIYYNKTMDRIALLADFKQFFNDVKINGKVRPGINHLMKNIDSLINTLLEPNQTIIHGDFFLGNILKDGDNIKLIDPRGSFGQTGIYGDPRYDWAKLAQDVFHNYSFIVHNKFKITNELDYEIETNEIVNYLKGYFIEFCPHNLSTINIITCLLFISMIPLHADDLNRQKILLSKGLEIYGNIL